MVETPTRTLPIRVAREPGEALSSWLLRLAHRLQLPVSCLLRTFGITSKAANGSWAPPSGFKRVAWLRDLAPQALRRIEFQAGLPVGSLDSAVARRFSDLAWPTLMGSRFCPDCIDDTDFAWPTRWYIPFTFACLRHRRLLSSRCPRCDRPPMNRLSLQSGLLPQYFCHNVGAARSGPCNADLRKQALPQLPDGDMRLVTQEWIDERITATGAEATRALHDLHHLVKWFRTSVRPDAYDRFSADTVESAIRTLPGTDVVQSMDTWLAAATATLAQRLLTSDDPGEVADHAQLLLHPKRWGNSRTTSRKPRRVVVRDHQLKPLSQLTSETRVRILTVADRQLPSVARLKHRTTTSMPSLADDASTRLAGERARFIPQRLWTDWLIRFRPPQSIGAGAIGTWMPAALLVPGNTMTTSESTAELARWATAYSQDLQRLSDRCSDVLPVICALAQYLDTHPAPIDYRRRRNTFTDVPMTYFEWQMLCGMVRERPGQRSRVLHARRHLLNLLTGADLEAPTCALTFLSKTEKFAFRRFEGDLSGPLYEALYQHARTLLHQAGICGEPLTWSPPEDCIPGLVLFGDPGQVDASAVRESVGRGLSVGQTAAALGVTIEHIQHALDQNHQANVESGLTLHRYAQPRSRPLDRRFFVTEYIGSRKTLKTISQQTGLPVRELSAAAAAAGVDIRAERDRRAYISIDEAWLREQHAARRAATDIAVELGIGHGTVRKRLAALGLRPHAARRVFRRPDVPEQIRPAVENSPRHGWLRLQRFRACAENGSFAAAARAVGCFRNALPDQMARLEATFGELLFAPTSTAQAIVLTDAGHDLLKVLRRRDVAELVARNTPSTKARRNDPGRPRTPGPARAATTRRPGAVRTCH